MASRRGKSGTSDRFSFLGLQKSLWTVTGAMKLKDACSLEGEYGKLRQHIKKQRHYFADTGPLNQSYSFSSSHLQMWELGCKEDWAPKNWCFQTVVLEKTLEGPLDCNEIKPVNPKGNQHWIFTGRTDAEAEAPILRPPDKRTDSLEEILMLGMMRARREGGSKGWDG